MDKDTDKTKTSGAVPKSYRPSEAELQEMRDNFAASDRRIAEADRNYERGHQMVQEGLLLLISH